MDSSAPLQTELPPAALAVLAGAQRRETTWEGRRTVWHVWGEGKPLFLLHGGSGSWTHWVRNVQALADAGRSVLVPDIPGFGDSDVALDATDADGVLTPLAQGFMQMAGPGPHEVMGFSFGALLAGLIAAQAPALVGRLVLVAPPGLGVRVRRLPLRPWQGIEDAAALDRIHRGNLATLMLHHAASIDEEAVAMHAANLRRDRMRGRKLALTDVLARALPGIRCPIDVVLGEQDALYRDDIDAFVGAVRAGPAVRSVSLLPGAGHWVQYEDAQAFNSKVLELLAST